MNHFDTLPKEELYSINEKEGKLILVPSHIFQWEIMSTVSVDLF